MKQVTKKWLPNLLIRSLVFVLIIYCLDFAIGTLLKFMYFRQNSGLLYRTTYAMDSTQADLLIFGSSTANHHYIPADFEKHLGLTTYNTGRDGNSILYHFAIFQSILERYTPKAVILDFNGGDFAKLQSNYDRLSSLLPYYADHPELRPVILLKSPFERFKLLSRIYPYNSLLFTIGAGNSGFNKNRESIQDENGYVPLDKTWTGPLINDTLRSRYPLDPEMIRLYRDFIKDCQDSHIQLYIFVSPPYLKFRYRDTSISLAESIAYENHIPFIDFTNDSLFLKNRAYYADAGHLNEEGASLYTNMVIDTMTDLMRKPEKNNFTVLKHAKYLPPKKKQSVQYSN